MRKGFTLVEMMVVVGIIMMLMAAMTVSVSNARTRAKIAKATQETREMTNAILAYEQYAKDRSLKTKVTGGSWKPCGESEMSMILGGETGESGEEIPVLFNASIRNSSIVDPWGRPYQYMIEATEELGSTINPPRTAAALPNYNRLSDKERGK